MRFGYLLLVFVAVAIYLGSLVKDYDMEAMDRVDLNRFQGTWYVIAHFPNSYEDKCKSDNRFTYTRLSGTQLKVVQTCRIKGGRTHSNLGMAWEENNKSNGAKFEVSFIPGLRDIGFFGQDYYILQLDIKYNYALVGSPDRKRLWVLARKPAIKKVIHKRLVEKAKELRFDVTQLTDVSHTG